MIDRVRVRNRIIDLTLKHSLSHLGSCLNAIDPLCDIYDVAERSNPVILSAGHAGLALYCVLEEKYHHDAEKMLNDYGIHPERDPARDIWCTTGSLGCGLPIALGYAFADRTRNVYCVISDGEASEGSIWEALRVSYDLSAFNLHISAILNGYGAYMSMNPDLVEERIKAFNPHVRIYKSVGCPQLEKIKVLGLAQHYYTISQEQADILKAQ